jgi:hypothetical protein
VPPEYEPPHAVIEPSVKSMAQSRRGVVQTMVAQVHPPVVAIPKFIQL